MTHTRARLCWFAQPLAPVALLGTLLGCGVTTRPVIDAFPTDDIAAPWILKGDVWSGSLVDAAPGLGRDANNLEQFGVTGVWLARYQHEERQHRRLTVRCFAFETRESATYAYEFLRPEDARPLEAGDEGCWTEYGILFRWGRLVLEIFGPTPSWDSQMQSAILSAAITRRMPNGAPNHPR